MVRLVLAEGMPMLGRLIIGLFCLFLLTVMTAVFGVGGFFFTVALFAVVAWAIVGI